MTANSLDLATTGLALPPEGQGRFISADPLGFVDGPSRYAAFGNDPVNHGDPMGLDSFMVSTTGEEGVIDGVRLYQMLRAEGLSVDDASRLVIQAGMGNDLNAHITDQMVPTMVAAQKVINTATATVAAAYGVGFGAAYVAPYLPDIAFALRHPVTAGTGACLSNPGGCQQLAGDLAYTAMGGQGPSSPVSVPKPRLDLPVPSPGPLKAASGNLDEAAHAARTQPYFPMLPPPPPRTVIGKVKDLKNVGESETTLLKYLPDQGNPQANWAQNSGVLRREMNKRLPIRDASVDPATGELIAYPGSFLNAERSLLLDRGWTYNPATRLWSPPG